jgi:methionine-rich copper-binding protein CopC
MKARSQLSFAAAIAAMLVSIASVCSAHSFPEKENPPAGDTLTSPPAQVTIKYDAPIEHLFDSLQVLDSAGHDETAGPPHISSDDLELSVPLNKLTPGEYTVKWRVVCIDTHHTEGSYSFTVSASKQ